MTSNSAEAPAIYAGCHEAGLRTELQGCDLDAYAVGSQLPC